MAERAEGTVFAMSEMEMETNKKKARVIGVTGGVGAGKSTVLAALSEHFGVLCLRTDELAKSLYQPKTAVYEGILALFGAEVLKKDSAQGELDFARMAELLYVDAEKKRALDKLVHPAVWALVRARIAEAEEAYACICVETALPQPDFLDICDEIWFVYTERETRIARLMADRHYSRKKAESIIMAQPSDASYEALADVVIATDEDKAVTSLRVQKAYLARVCV